MSRMYDIIIIIQFYLLQLNNNECNSKLVQPIFNHVIGMKILAKYIGHSLTYMSLNENLPCGMYILTCMQILSHITMLLVMSKV